MSKIVEALRKLTSVDKPNKKLIKESIVHMKDENTFNDLIPTSSLKVGDVVYDDETGHKLKVEEISNDVRSKYARKITFTDLDTMQSVVRYPGINWMYEKVFDNDVEFEVDDDIDMEFYPIDTYFESRGVSVKKPIREENEERNSRDNIYLNYVKRMKAAQSNDELINIDSEIQVDDELTDRDKETLGYTFLNQVKRLRDINESKLNKVDPTDVGFQQDLYTSYKNAIEAGLKGKDLEAELIKSFKDNENYKGFYHPKAIEKTVKDYIKLKSLNEAIEDEEISEVEQEFTSANTSINKAKLPAIFKLATFEPGTVNLDFGGGKFDNAAEYLKEYDVVNLVYDPYNRSKEHNNEVIKQLKERGGADTATCSNVLNVIKEPEARHNVLSNIKKFVKPNGKVYITVYEGSGTGEGGATSAGYQLNRKTADYLDEIKEIFPDAKRNGKLIVASAGQVTESLLKEATSNVQMRKRIYSYLSDILSDTFESETPAQDVASHVDGYDPEWEEESDSAAVWKDWSNARDKYLLTIVDGLMKNAPDTIE